MAEVNEFEAKIGELRANIYGSLVPLIVSDYVLLDCPYHSNIGDILIWHGEQSFLDKIPFRCLGQSSRLTFRSGVDIRHSDTILLHGGGNFGDLWREHQQFRLDIIARYPDNRIVIFPQTVHYKDKALMADDAEAFACHPDLTICARDAVSFDILKENFRNNIILVPDMAFCIDIVELAHWKLPVTKGDVYVKRLDQELAPTGDSLLKYPDAQVRDWPTFERHDWRTVVLMGLLRVVRITRRARATGWIADLFSRMADRFAGRAYVRYMTKTGVRFLSPYRSVYTTRLHAGILSILLYKSCRFIDNSYGKNSSFFETWLKGMDGVDMDGK